MEPLRQCRPGWAMTRCALVAVSLVACMRGDQRNGSLIPVVRRRGEHVVQVSVEGTRQRGGRAAFRQIASSFSARHIERPSSSSRASREACIGHVA